MSTHRINASVQGAKMLLNLDLPSVFCKLTEPLQPSPHPHQIIFVYSHMFETESNAFKGTNDQCFQ